MSRVRKTKKQEPTHLTPLKMSPGAENMKTGPDALGIAGNESGHAKHANGTRHPRYRGKRVRECKTLNQDLTPSVLRETTLGAQKIKTGPGA
jgi:hypothetical protein